MDDAERYRELVHALEDLMSRWDSRRNEFVREFNFAAERRSAIAEIRAEVLATCIGELDKAVGSVTKREA